MPYPGIVSLLLQSSHQDHNFFYFCQFMRHCLTARYNRDIGLSQSMLISALHSKKQMFFHIAEVLQYVIKKSGIQVWKEKRLVEDNRLYPATNLRCFNDPSDSYDICRLTHVNFIFPGCSKNIMIRFCHGFVKF